MNYGCLISTSDICSPNLGAEVRCCFEKAAKRSDDFNVKFHSEHTMSRTSSDGVDGSLLSRLPSEVLHIIFGYLDYRDLWMCVTVPNSNATGLTPCQRTGVNVRGVHAKISMAVTSAQMPCGLGLT